MTSLRIAMIFDNFGPYHVARLSALAAVSKLHAIELRERSVEYAWHRSNVALFPCYTLLSANDSQESLPVRLRGLLCDISPDIVFVSGWSDIGAVTTLRWCGEQKIPVIVMSDSQRSDFARHPAKEWVKRRLIAHASGALVAGTPHRDYAISLGIDPKKIRYGLDVVDNQHFASRAELARQNELIVRERLGLPRSYILASARFVGKKNLSRLLEAYAASRNGLEDAPDLVMLGDGPLRLDIEAKIEQYNIGNVVHLPGYIQYADLPEYYGLALGFVHASTTEQWGLVVNEAMASGLPVIVSERCGCAVELVQQGLNGHVFDPLDTVQLVGLIRELASLSATRRAQMGQYSREIISNWTLDMFARNVILLAEACLANSPKRLTLFNSLLLQIVAWHLMR